jgi:predicted ATPase
MSARLDGGVSGLYLLDEPESALSFTGCLSWVQLLSRIATSGDAQAIVGTPLPIVSAVLRSVRYLQHRQ